MLREDALALWSAEHAIVLGTALGGSLALRDDLDEDVRDSTSRHPERWGDAGEMIGGFGEPQYQVPALLAVYGYGLRHPESRARDLSLSLISAYTLTGLGTTLVKGVTNTDRPSREWNDGEFGFPSFHVASSMSLAAVLDEYYGPTAGVPAYALAAAVGYSRIDQRDHDLSDVVFGAAMGWVIGKTVAGRHLRNDGSLRLLPWCRPADGASGMAFELAY
ncbi:MAG: phosphatase PAP2 family protein [Planctomycetes bacterium]|nr:phosphatase PAP2 family protein [Planctomycetota bacterium]